MKQTPEERKKRREQFARMSPGEKLGHIWLYYKVPIALALIAVGFLVSSVYTLLTRREPVLYTAYLNVAMGDQLESTLLDQYYTFAGLDPEKSEILVYRDLYLSDNPTAADHEYAYSSRLKVLATINSKQLDLVLMNQEAYDLCSGSGYLLELDPLFPAGDPCAEPLLPYLTSNLVVLEDNGIDYNLGKAEEYVTVTESAVNALDLSRHPAFAQAGFSGTVYLGIIANTPRLSNCKDFLLSLSAFIQ